MSHVAESPRSMIGWMLGNDCGRIGVPLGQHPKHPTAPSRCPVVNQRPNHQHPSPFPSIRPPTAIRPPIAYILTSGPGTSTPDVSILSSCGPAWKGLRCEVAAHGLPQGHHLPRGNESSSLVAARGNTRRKHCHTTANPTNWPMILGGYRRQLRSTYVTATRTTKSKQIPPPSLPPR